MPRTEQAAGLEQWCAKHSTRLAEQFVAEDTDERGDPRVFFEANASRLALTQSYRPASEAVFFSHLLKLEARDAGTSEENRRPLGRGRRYQSGSGGASW